MRPVKIIQQGILGEFPFVILEVGFPEPGAFWGSERHWMNGYVGVPAGHPWYGKGYDDLEVEVHGGLTYADHMNSPEVYANEAGQPWRGMNIWWVGFDTTHSMDHDLGGTWLRSEAYVFAECESLARQAASELTRTPESAFNQA